MCIKWRQHLYRKDVLYGVCTGNILNEELNAFGDVKAKGTYTDEIYEIEFNDVEAKMM